MAKTYTTSQSGTGSSAAIDVDPDAHGEYTFVAVVTGTVNYDIEMTIDGTTWATHQDADGLTASVMTSFYSPLTQVRVTVNSGAGSVDLTVLERNQT